jgi:pyridoxamine 5'-phosphate oxidase
VEAISLPPWRSALARALHRNRSLVYSRYAQLATVAGDGRPHNRTIVFRGFGEGNRLHDLKFITDQRSEKMMQLQANSWAELCWYFPKTREQFRIAGQCTIIDAMYPNPTDQKSRRITWHNLSSAARSQFAWPRPAQDLASPEAFESDDLDPNQPLDDFALLYLNPIQVDHLELKGQPDSLYPQSRCRYSLEMGEWRQRSVNP